jgi:hypothetical protein
LPRGRRRKESSILYIVDEPIALGREHPMAVVDDMVVRTA